MEALPTSHGDRQGRGDLLSPSHPFSPLLCTPRRVIAAIPALDFPHLLSTTLHFMPQAAGEVIRQRRRERGLKVGEFAASVSISPQHLDNIEAGRKSASIEVLYRIANALDLPIDDVRASA